MDGERRDTIEDNVQVPRVYLMYHAPSFNAPEFETSDLVTHLLADGYDIRTVQELLGHKDVRTTMIYTHVLNRGGRGVRSPADGLGHRPDER